MEGLESYKELKKHCFKTRLGKVSRKVIEYLQDESNVIPERYFSKNLQVEGEEKKTAPEHITAELDSLKLCFDSAVAEFKSLYIKIEAQGCKDMANWVTNLQFTTFDELLMCIKYSDMLSDYLQDLPDNMQELMLVFKKWYSLNKAMEFHCFVLDNKLKGICQRYTNAYYDFYPSFFSTSMIDSIQGLFEKIDKCVGKAECRLKRQI